MGARLLQTLSTTQTRSIGYQLTGSQQYDLSVSMFRSSSSVTSESDPCLLTWEWKRATADWQRRTTPGRAEPGKASSCGLTFGIRLSCRIDLRTGQVTNRGLEDGA